ncbi:MAG TPA: hypothetical protein VHC95_10745 [Opitutales bacterium]|nr:hypothetical protein [Opitutales bacterium]
MPWRPRGTARTFLAALISVAAGASVGVARADPPPLVVPAAEPAPVASPAAPAAAPAAGNESVHIDFGHGVEQANGTMLYGDEKPVEVDLWNFRLFATQVLNSGNVLQATGEVELAYESNRAIMRKAAIDGEKRVIIADQIRLGKAPAYIDGAQLIMGAQQGELTNPTIYFGEPDPFGLNIKANRATLDFKNDEVVLHGATLRLGSVPFFYLPEYTQGRESQPPISLQAHFGYRKDLGGYVQSTTYFTKNAAIQPGVLLDFYSQRGPLAGPALRYDLTKDPDWLQYGQFESGYIHDYGSRGLDLLNSQIPKDRFWVNWQHQGEIGGMLDVNASMAWWRDSYVLRDFRQSEWRDNQLPDNFVELSHREQNTLTSAFVRYRPNDFELVQERLPETRLDYFASPLLNTGIYQEGSAGYVQLIQPNFNGTPTLHSNRFDGYYGWRRPVNIGDWATFTPVAGGRITQYQDTLGQQGDFTRMLGQVGFDSEVRALGRWDYSNPTWGINGLQHVLRPIVQYRYIPAAQQGQGLIPVIDQDFNSNYPPILDLGDTRSIDFLHSENVLRYGVENLLQTRADGYGSRDLASFNVYNDIHFQRASGQEDVSDVWAGLGLNPASWLSFQVYDRIDPTAFTNREVRTSTMITDGDRWNISLNTSSLQHQFNQYWLDGQYRVSERVRLYGRWRYDEHVGGLVEQFYGIRQRLGEAWDLEYGVSYYRSAANQDGFGFNVKLILLAE